MLVKSFGQFSIIKRSNMRNRRAPEMKRLLKKSRKDLDVYRLNMNLNKRYSVSKANVDVKSRPVNVQLDNMLVKRGSKTDHQLASSSSIKKSTTIVRDSYISSKNQKNSTTLSSKDDSNEVGCSNKSQTLNMKGGMVQRSNDIENSVLTPLKPTTRLVLKETTVNTCSLSRKMGQSRLSQGDVVIGKSDSYEKLELAESNHKKVDILKVISPNLTSSPLDGKLQEMKSNLGNQHPRMFGVDLSNCQQGKDSCMTNSNSAILSSMAHSELCDSNGHTNSGKYKRWSEPLMEGKPQTNGDIRHIDGVVQLDNQMCRPLKKTRRLLVAIEDEDEDGDKDKKIEDICCDQNHMGVEDDTSRFTHQTTICKDDSQAKVEVSSHVQHHSYCCSKPIDEPVWSGIFKINGKEYMSLVGHLSTKSGKKACQFSKSLTPIIHMTKISRLEVWPKGWEISKTDDNNIGLYFFPHKTRVVEKELDQLVNELIENDLALRAVINEVEILIFTSTLLPRRHQTFQTKHYLWGVFRHKKDKGIGAQERHSMDFESRATQEVRQGDTLCPTTHPAEANAIATRGTSTISTSMMYGFVVPQTSRFVQLIQEMEREGAVVWKGIQS